MDTLDSTATQQGDVTKAYAQVLGAKVRLQNGAASNITEGDRFELVRTYLGAVGAWVATMEPGLCPAARSRFELAAVPGVEAEVSIESNRFLAA